MCMLMHMDCTSFSLCEISNECVRGLAQGTQAEISAFCMIKPAAKSSGQRQNKNMAASTRTRWLSTFLKECLCLCVGHEVQERKPLYQWHACNMCVKVDCNGHIWRERWPSTFSDGWTYLCVCQGMYEWKIICYLYACRLYFTLLRCPRPKA